MGWYGVANATPGQHDVSLLPPQRTFCNFLLLLYLCSLGEAQYAFFDFCMGNCLQIMANVWVEAVKVTPKPWIVWVEVVKEAHQIRLSQNYGTNYTLFCGLAHVWVQSVKIVL